MKENFWNEATSQKSFYKILTISTKYPMYRMHLSFTQAFEQPILHIDGRELLIRPLKVIDRYYK